MKFFNNKERALSVEITPLIDIVFLLVIFFVVTSKIEKNQYLTLDLPSTESFSSSLINAYRNIILLDTKLCFFIFIADSILFFLFFFQCFFVFPMKIFWQYLSHDNDEVSIYAYCGILFVFSFAIFGQTQSIFSSNDVLIFFIFFLFLFISQISRLINIQEKRPSNNN